MINEQKGKSGSLFRQKTKAKCLSEMAVNPGDMQNRNDYHHNCFYYIHQNPLKAGLVNELEEWIFSSYLDYAGLRNGSLCNKILAEKYGLFNPQTFSAMCKNFQ